MIEKIHIKALKSIRELTVKCSDINLLVGTNSSGKSTFLQALLLMAQKTACVSWSTAWRRSLAMNCALVSIAQRVMRLSTITATT